MRDRIKKLRKALDLTQSDFAARIGSTQNNIANYETGRRSPSAAALNNICKEFSVNEEWLRTGNGEMFKAAPSCALDMLADTYHLEHSEYILIEKFVNMKPESRRVIMDYIREVAAAVGNEMYRQNGAVCNLPVYELPVDAEFVHFKCSWLSDSAGV